MSLYEFSGEYTYDTGDTTVTGTGSGVHLNRDVSFTFDILDRSSNKLTNSIDINNNPFIGDMAVSIINTGGSVVYPNYYSGTARRTFTFKEQDNIDVFGSYQKDFGVLVDLKDNTASAFDAEFYAYGNNSEIESITITDGSGVTTYQNYIGIEWSGSSITESSGQVPKGFWDLDRTNAKFTLNDFANSSGDYSQDQSATATGYVTAPDDTDLTLYWDAVNISESENADYDIGTIEFDGVNVFGGRSVGDGNGITPNYTYGNGSVVIPSGTSLEIEINYDNIDNQWQDTYFGIELNVSIEPNPTTTITSTTPSGITGYMLANVEFLNDPQYTKLKSIDVYTGSSTGIVENEESFLTSIPILTQEKILDL